MDWKTALYERIAPHVAPGAIIASNTSGLSIDALGHALPEQLRRRFGIHFFNPPRYMRLVEIIATSHTEPRVLDQLETWLTSTLGKGVIRALDTPNFVANRIGVFSILAAMHHTARLGLGFDEVDALTGPKIGRPKSATYRTADVVGLDTLAHVIGTMDKNLADDPWHRYFKQPEWLAALISKGALGRKSGAGVYRKAGREIQVLDLESPGLPPQRRQAGRRGGRDPQERDPAKRFAALRASSHPQAQFLWSLFRDIFHYSAAQLANVADNARDLDLAMRWGFRARSRPGRPPAGNRSPRPWPRTRRRPPAWALEPARQGVHAPEGSYSARSGKLHARSALPVYRRQIYPERVFGEAPDNRGVTVWKTKACAFGTCPTWIGRGHPVGHLQEPHAGRRGAGRHPAGRGPRRARVRRPGHLASGSLRRGRQPAAGGRSLRRRPVGHAGSHGREVPARLAGLQVRADPHRRRRAGHGARRRLRVPDACLAPRAGAGKLHRPGRGRRGPDPAGGGSKEFAGRAAALAAKTATPGEVFPFLQPIFQTIATAQVAKSAREAIETGFAREQDIVLFHPDELLFVAIGQARAAAQAGYVPPARLQNVPVAGRNGIANFEMMLVNMREGGMISAHDYRVARSPPWRCAAARSRPARAWTRNGC